MRFSSPQWLFNSASFFFSFFFIIIISSPTVRCFCFCRATVCPPSEPSSVLFRLLLYETQNSEPAEDTTRHTEAKHTSHNVTLLRQEWGFFFFFFYLCDPVTLSNHLRPEFFIYVIIFSTSYRVSGLIFRLDSMFLPVRQSRGAKIRVVRNSVTLITKQKCAFFSDFLCSFRAKLSLSYSTWALLTDLLLNTTSWQNPATGRRSWADVTAGGRAQSCTVVCSHSWSLKPRSCVRLADLYQAGLLFGSHAEGAADVKTVKIFWYE